MSSDQHDEMTVHHARDPTLVRTIVEERGGYPAHLAGSESEGDQGLLRIGFPAIEDEEFKEISWEEFEEEFEEKNMAAVYPADEEATLDGTHPMRLVKRDAVEDEE